MRPIRKGQRLVLASEGPSGQIHHHERYQPLPAAIETMCVGGGGWYRQIYVVRVERVVDVDRYYKRWVARRDRRAAR